MKIFHIFLCVTLFAIIVCGNYCFGAVDFGHFFKFSSQNKSTEDINNLAKKEFDNYNYKKAIRLYKQALKSEPSNSENIYLHIGISYNMLGKYKKAIKLLNKSIEINSENSSTYYNRGYAYYKLKKFDKAKQDFKKAIDINKPVYQYDIKEAHKKLEHIEFLESCE